MQKNKKKEIISFTVFSLILAVLVTKAIAQQFYFHLQPYVVKHFVPLIEHRADNSFPSDHTVIALTVAASIFLYNKKLGTALGILGLLIGVSRVLAGLHWPVDILASFVIAIFCALVVYLLIWRTGLKKQN